MLRMTQKGVEVGRKRIHTNRGRPSHVRARRGTLAVAARRVYGFRGHRARYAMDAEVPVVYKREFAQTQ
eukprot:427592-Rhodomonas_salina.1